MRYVQAQLQRAVVLAVCKAVAEVFRAVVAD
jgi:hypothetical protein